MSVEAAKHARELLLKEYRGVLSTHSKSMPGFPFGSVVPYCLDEQGRPLILISRIAQHTHDLQKDPKCSLLVGERGAEDVPSRWSPDLPGRGAQDSKTTAAIEAAAERYYRYFPDSQNYHKAHDFDFWVLKPVRHRYIGGFGAIHWVHRADPGQSVRRQGRSEHGRAHECRSRQAIAHYVELAGPCRTTCRRNWPVYDSEGMHLRIGQGLHWLPFRSAL